MPLRLIANAETVFRNRDPSVRGAQAHAGSRRAHRRPLDRPRELPRHLALSRRRRRHDGARFATVSATLPLRPSSSGSTRLAASVDGSRGRSSPPSPRAMRLNRCSAPMSAPRVPPGCRLSPAITPRTSPSRGSAARALNRSPPILSAKAEFFSEPFEVSRFVVFSSRASVGGGPYVVEAAYPLED